MSFMFAAFLVVHFAFAILVDPDADDEASQEEEEPAKLSTESYYSRHAREAWEKSVLLWENQSKEPQFEESRSWLAKETAKEPAAFPKETYESGLAKDRYYSAQGRHASTRRKRVSLKEHQSKENSNLSLSGGAMINASESSVCSSLTGIMPSVTMLYVNLEKRVDRRQEFEAQLEKYFRPLKDCLGWDWDREVGYDLSDENNASNVLQAHGLPTWMQDVGRHLPRLGCFLSHFHGVQKVARDPSRHVFMFEDDFQFKVEPAEFWSKLRAFFHEFGNSGWDVLMLGHNRHGGRATPTAIDGFERLNGYTWTTSSYLVNSQYIPTLIKEWQKFVGTTPPKSFTSVDEAWNLLQVDPNSRWFLASPRLGLQRNSYSDIEKTTSSYGVSSFHQNASEVGQNKNGTGLKSAASHLQLQIDDAHVMQ